MRNLPRAAFYYGRSIVSIVRFVRPWSLLPLLMLGRAGDGPHRIALPAFDVAFDVRTAMDIWSVKEVFIDRFYEWHGFAVRAGWTVVDIGAAIGEFTVLAARVPNTQVVALEPFPGSAALLSRNVGLNGVPNVDIIAKAVAGKAGFVAMDTRRDEPVLFQTRPADTGAAAVEAITLADIVSITPNQRIDLLKLDCEGAEFEIVMRSLPETLAVVQRIVMEYHDGVMELGHGDLEGFLVEAGYAVESVRNDVHPDAIGYMRAWRPEVTGQDQGVALRRPSSKERIAAWASSRLRRPAVA